MGRGQKILDTPVMTLAKEENLKIIEGVDLNDASLIDQLKDLNPDFFVVVAYRILPKSLLDIPNMDPLISILHCYQNIEEPHQFNMHY